MKNQRASSDARFFIARANSFAPAAPQKQSSPKYRARGKYAQSYPDLRNTWGQTCRFMMSLQPKSKLAHCARYA